MAIACAAAVLMTAAAPGRVEAARMHFEIDPELSVFQLEATVQIPSLDIEFPLFSQGAAGLGIPGFSDGFSFQIFGTLVAEIDDAAGTISFPGGSSVRALPSGQWLPGTVDAATPSPAAVGLFINILPYLGAAGTAAIALREPVLDVWSFGIGGTKTLTPIGPDAYSFDSAVDIVSVSGSVEYAGRSGLLVLAGEGQFPFDRGLAASLGAEGTLAGPPGGQRTLVLPIDTTFDNLLLDDGSVFGLGEIPVQVHVTGTVHAQSIDGPHPCPTFEDGTLEGWQGYGAVSVVDASFGTGPAEGNFQALLTTGAGAISAAEIDALLGGDGLLAAFDFFDAVEGSVLFGSFELAESGGVLTFDWNFLTDEAPSASFNDTAFVLVDIGLDAWLPPLLLADTNGTFVLSLTDFVKETGYNSSASLPFVFDRRIRVAFVVLDRGDDEVDSALLIDNICLPALVPEPSSLVLALPALGVIARRRSKAAARKRARRPAQ